MTAPAHPAKHPARWRADLALAFVALIWGSTFVLVKDALNDSSTILFLAIRFSVATVAVAFVYFRTHGFKLKGRPWTGGIVTGVFLFSGYLLQTLGLRLTTPAKSGFLTGIYIVLVPFFIAIVYRRRPQISEVLGVTAAGIGLGLMSLTGETLTIGTGDALTIGCAVAFAFHIMILGHFSRRMEFEWLALLQIGTCAVIASATFGFMERPFLRSSPRLWVAIAVTALLGTALAFSVQTWAQRFTTTTRTALILALEPVFAWGTSFVLEGEVLTARAIGGAGLILAGILLVELKPIGRHRHRIKQT